MNLQLKQLRKLKQLTQEELGARVNVSNRVVSSWECGVTDISLADAVNVADVLEVTLDELAGRDFVSRRRSLGSLDSEEHEIVQCYRDCTPQWRRQIAMSARSAVVISKEETERVLDDALGRPA